MVYLTVRVPRLKEKFPAYMETIDVSSQTLNSWGLDLFTAELEAHVEYHFMNVNGIKHVQHSRTPEAPPQMFVDRCLCPKRKSFIPADECSDVHIIALSNGNPNGNIHCKT